jgi:hypothetical protein
VEGAIWSFGKVMGLPWIEMGHKGAVSYWGSKTVNPVAISQSVNQSIQQSDSGPKKVPKHVAKPLFDYS